jgi:AcrR family transcriptional regulator
VKKATRGTKPQSGKRSPKRTWDRRKNPARREDLLQRFVDYLLEHGFAEVSLQQAAGELGTSARMLLHYFGSKEKLVEEAIGAVRARQLQFVFGEEMTMDRFDELFWRAFSWCNSDGFLSVFRLTYEILWAALRNPERYRGFLDQVTTEWQQGFAVAMQAAGYSEAHSRTVSTAYLAALRGLVIDVIVTGDHERASEAAALIARHFRADLGVPPPPPAAAPRKRESTKKA